jgi:hypothetical protein
MRTRAWFVYPVLAALATVVYYLTGDSSSGHVSYVFNAIGLSSPVLIFVAVKLHRPEKRWPWLWIAIGQLLFISGDVLAYNYVKFHDLLPGFFKLSDGGLPYPSWADPVYLAVYPCLIAGILLLIHARNPGRDRDSLLDSLMVAIGVGTISWVLLIAPYVSASDIDLKTKLVSMAYPSMDLLLAAAAIRLAVGAGKRPPAFYLIVAGIVALFGTDALYGWRGLHTPYTPGTGLLEIGWISFYVMFGMAALHPSMRALCERAPDVETKLTKPRLAVLGGASLVAPGILALQVIRGDTQGQFVLVVATIVLFFLVVTRMWGLVRTQQESASREKALREAGAALVTATNKEGILSAALEASQSLAGEGSLIRVCALGDGDGQLDVVAATGGDESIGGT